MTEVQINQAFGRLFKRSNNPKETAALTKLKALCLHGLTCTPRPIADAPKVNDSYPLPDDDEMSDLIDRLKRNLWETSTDLELVNEAIATIAAQASEIKELREGGDMIKVGKVITATKGEWKLNRTTYKGSPVNELLLADERICTLSNASIVDLIDCLSESIQLESTIAAQANTIEELRAEIAELRKP